MLTKVLIFDFLAFGNPQRGDSLSGLPAEISQFGYAFSAGEPNILFPVLLPRTGENFAIFDPPMIGNPPETWNKRHYQIKDSSL